MTPKIRYWLSVALIVLTLGLLYPGLTQPALTINAMLDAEGLGQKVDVLAKSAIPPERLKQVRRFLNPEIFGDSMDDAGLNERIGLMFGAIVRGKVEGASAQMDGQLVYQQKQQVLETIRYLLEHGGYTAGILLLVFSIGVPVGKVLLFLFALHTSAPRREKILGFINVIGKWSMADVFLVAIYTAYLGARSSVGVGQAIHFETHYGPGFYWFAAYCLVSLAAQQAAVGLMRDWRRNADATAPTSRQAA